MECLHRVLHTAVAAGTWPAGPAPSAGVVLRREYEGSEPQICQRQVDRQHVSTVRLNRRQGHGDDVQEKRKDSLGRGLVWA